MVFSYPWYSVFLLTEILCEWFTYTKIKKKIKLTWLKKCFVPLQSPFSFFSRMEKKQPFFLQNGLTIFFLTWHDEGQGKGLVMKK